MVECPAGECDYSGPKKSVAAHYSGKSDTLHDGGYKTAEAMLESSETQPDQQQSEAEDGDEEATDESHAPARSTNPSKEAPPADEQQTADEEEHGPEDGCPKCGGELIDFRDHETYRQDGREIDTPDDYYCSECGSGFMDV